MFLASPVEPFFLWKVCIGPEQILQALEDCSTDVLLVTMPFMVLSTFGTFYFDLRSFALDIGHLAFHMIMIQVEAFTAELCFSGEIPNDPFLFILTGSFKLRTFGNLLSFSIFPLKVCPGPEQILQALEDPDTAAVIFSLLQHALWFFPHLGHFLLT